MSPTQLELVGSTGGVNNSHTYPIVALYQPLNDILRHDIPRILYDSTKLVNTVGITHVSLTPVPLRI